MLDLRLRWQGIARIFMNAVAKRLRPKSREGNHVKAERDFLDLSLNLIPESRTAREDRPL